MNSPWTLLDTLFLYSVELCSQKEDSILKSNKMKKKNYQKPSMTVAEMNPQGVICQSGGFGALYPFSGYGSGYGSGFEPWDPLGY